MANEKTHWTGRDRHDGSWSDGHLEDCVREAYQRGVTDTLFVIQLGMSPRELAAHQVLRMTHGMLAPKGEG